MKHLTTYKLFESKDHALESYIYNGINYKYKWAVPASKIRREINLDINNILLDARDLGYGGHAEWVDDPCVWIGVKLMSGKIFDIHELSPIVQRIKNYLTSEGFDVKFKMISNQIWIYFSK